MSVQMSEFQSDHTGIINCIKYSPDGRRIATGGSDGKINIFEIQDQRKIVKQKELLYHQHSIWDLSWYEQGDETFLASCGYDCNLVIWYENKQNPGAFEIIFRKKYNSSVNSCAFAPNEYGPYLGLCNSEGQIYFLEQKNGAWEEYLPLSKDFFHTSRVNSISWGPAVLPINFDPNKIEVDDEDLNPLRLVSCGNDGKIIEWKWGLERNEKISAKELIYESDKAVTDVAWLNCIGYSLDTIVASFEDGKIFIFKYKTNGGTSKWEKTSEIEIGCQVLKVAWSNAGGYLGVYTNENTVRFFQENLDEGWEEINRE